MFFIDPQTGRAVISNDSSRGVFIDTHTGKVIPIETLNFNVFIDVVSARLLIAAKLKNTRLAFARLDRVYCGSPYCTTVANDNLSMKLMDFAYCGAPVVSYSKG